MLETLCGEHRGSRESVVRFSDPDAPLLATALPTVTVLVTHTHLYLPTMLPLGTYYVTMNPLGSGAAAAYLPYLSH